MTEEKFEAILDRKLNETLDRKLEDVFDRKLRPEFLKIDGRFDKLEIRIDTLDGRLGKVEGRLGKVEGRLGKVENLLETHAAAAVDDYSNLQERFNQMGEQNRRSHLELKWLLTDTVHRDEFLSIKQRVEALEKHTKSSVGAK